MQSLICLSPYRAVGRKNLLDFGTSMRYLLCELSKNKFSFFRKRFEKMFRWNFMILDTNLQNNTWFVTFVKKITFWTKILNLWHIRQNFCSPKQKYARMLWIAWSPRSGFVSFSNMIQDKMEWLCYKTNKTILETASGSQQ